MAIPNNISTDNTTVTIGPVVTDIKLIGKSSLCFKDQQGATPKGNLTNQPNQTEIYNQTGRNQESPLCLPPAGIFVVCGTDAYLCLPAN